MYRLQTLFYHTCVPIDMTPKRPVLSMHNGLNQWKGAHVLGPTNTPRCGIRYFLLLYKACKRRRTERRLCHVMLIVSYMSVVTVVNNIWTIQVGSRMFESYVKYLLSILDELIILVALMLELSVFIYNLVCKSIVYTLLLYIDQSSIVLKKIY